MRLLASRRCHFNDATCDVVIDRCLVAAKEITTNRNAVFTEPRSRRFNQFGHATGNECGAFKCEDTNAGLIDLDEETTFDEVLIHEEIR